MPRTDRGRRAVARSLCSVRFHNPGRARHVAAEAADGARGGLLYVATVKALKSEKKYAPENARQGMVDGIPSPHGYGTKGGDSGMSDTSLFGGQMLYAMLEAYAVSR